MTVNQPSALPTRKLTAAMLGASVAGLLKAFVVQQWPFLADPIIWEPLPYAFGFLLGYVVKDAPNVEGAE